MFVLFGIQNRPVDHGPLFRKMCGNCKQETMWKFFERNESFTLFLLPVSRMIEKYYAVCSNCLSSYKVTERGEIEKFKALASANRESKVFGEEKILPTKSQKTEKSAWVLLGIIGIIILVFVVLMLKQIYFT